MNRYEAARTRKRNLKHKGFDYNNRLLRISIDPNLMQNPTVNEVVTNVDRLIQESVISIKNFKKNINPFINKDDFDFN